MIRNTSTQAGFSLVEVLVSLGLFAVTVTISVGALLVLINANANTQNTQILMNNLSAMLDSMVRDIRTGTYYYCGVSMSVYDVGDSDTSDCVNGSTFVFTESGGSLTGVTGGRVGFRRSVVDGVGVAQRKIGTGNWTDISPPDVDVTSLSFVVTNTDSDITSNEESPMVTIYLSGTVSGVTGNDSLFELQTTITQQSLDI